MHLLLIDGFNLIRRIYEARPHDDSKVEDEVINSAAHSMNRALRQHQPSHACCVFDSHLPTWRHALYPAYKANRKPTPPALLEAIPQFEEAFKASGVLSYCLAHYEADDVIATLAEGLSKRGGAVTILSTDKNFLQLLDEHISIYDHFKETVYTAEWVVKKYGISHSQLLDYWAMTGDSTNNIKGVDKVGPKTAAKLLTQYKSLEAFFANPGKDAISKRILAHKQDAEDARQLAQLKTDLKLALNLNQLRYTGK